MLNQFFKPGGGPSAFEQFLTGEQAEQRYDLNQQAMDANTLAMAQAEKMNPLLLKAQQAGIDLTGAQTAGVVGGERRAGEMHPGALLAQTAGIDLTNQQIAASQTGQDLTRQQIANSKFNLDNAKKEQKKSQEIESARMAERALDQYESLVKSDPQAAEQFKQEQFDKYGIDEDSFNPALIRAAANVVTMETGDEFQQVKGMPGMVFNATKGTYSSDQQTLERAIELKEKDGILKGKDLQSVNKDVTAMVAEPTKIVNAARDLRILRKNNNPSDQLAAIFKFMKAQDPASVVREGEQEMLQKTGGKWDWLVGQWQSAKGEGMITETTFDNIIETADNMAYEASRASGESLAGYLDVLEDNLTAKSYQRLMARVPKLEERESSSAPSSSNYVKPQSPQSKSTAAKQNDIGEIPGSAKRIKMTAEDMESLL